MPVVARKLLINGNVSRLSGTRQNGRNMRSISFNAVDNRTYRGRVYNVNDTRYTDDSQNNAVQLINIKY